MKVLHFLQLLHWERMGGGVNNDGSSGYRNSFWMHLVS